MRGSTITSRVSKHGAYGVVVAQRLVEPLVPVRSWIGTPDAETNQKTEKPRFFDISVRDPVALLFPFHSILDSWNHYFPKVRVRGGSQLL